MHIPLETNIWKPIFPIFQIFFHARGVFDSNPKYNVVAELFESCGYEQSLLVKFGQLINYDIIIITD